jgi:hypothetical protein
MILIIFLTICLSTVFSQLSKSEYVSDFEKGYYPINTTHNKILNINNDLIIFYGENGNIIKTYDQGETLTQEFTGTYGRIIKLFYLNNSIIGITNHSEIITSYDEGEFWEINNTNLPLNDMIILDDIIYISMYPSDTIMISYDFGNSFQFRKTGIKNVTNIYSINNKLILQKFQQRFQYEFFYSNKDALNWQSIPQPPIPIREITSKNNRIYVNDYYSVAELKGEPPLSDFTWTNYYLYDSTDWSKPSYNFFSIYPKDDNFLIFKVLHTDGYGGEAIYSFSEYNVSEKKIIPIDTLDLIRINGFGNYNYTTNNLFINDLIKVNEVYYFTFRFDKIIKYKPNEELKIINEKAKLLYNRIFDNQNWFAFSDYMSYFIFSEDNGKTFKPSASFYEKFYWSFSGDSLEVLNIPNEQNIYFKSIDSFVIPIRILYNVESRRGVQGIDIKNVILSNDKGDTFISLRENIREYFYKDGNVLLEDLIPRSHIENKYLFSIKDGSNTKFYLLDENNNFSFASELDSTQSISCYYDKINNITWLRSVGSYQIIENDSAVIKLRTAIYYTKDGLEWNQFFESFNNINSGTLLGISNKGDLYLIVNDGNPKIMKFELENNSVSEIKFNSKYKSIYYGYALSYIYHFHETGILLNLETNKFYGEWSETIDGKTTVKKDLILFNFENEEIEIKTHFEDFGSNRFVNNFVDTEDFNYFRHTYFYDVNFIPIEEDKYKYYSSINQKDINKELLEVSSFPNPAPKGQTINLELEVYADKVSIYDLLGNEIMKLNQFSNKYEIPTANISPGVYIAIIESSGKRKITKFIVE